MDWAGALPASMASLAFPRHNRHVVPVWTECVQPGGSASWRADFWPALHLHKSCLSGMFSESLGAACWAVPTSFTGIVK